MRPLHTVIAPSSQIVAPLSSTEELRPKRCTKATIHKMFQAGSAAGITVACSVVVDPSNKSILKAD